MRELPAIVGLRGLLRNVLKGDGAFHILPRKYCLVFPFHKNLDIRGHGEGCRVTM